MVAPWNVPAVSYDRGDAPDLIPDTLPALCHLSFVHPHTEGYIKWSRENACHIRWWSEERRKFAGKITASKRVQKVMKYKFNRNDSLEDSEKFIHFKSNAQGGKVEGLDILTDEGAFLEIDLSIQGQDDVLGIIILDAEKRIPQEMPFILR